MVLFSMATLATATFLIPIALGAAGPDCTNGPLKSNKICDTSATPAERAAALVAAMTQQEKLANLVRYASIINLNISNWAAK